MKNRIAIIGGGAAGVTVLNELVATCIDRKKYDVEITIYEKGPKIGPGLAYSTPDSGHIINLKAELMHAAPNQLVKFGNSGNSPYDSSVNYLSNRSFISWTRENDKRLRAAFPELNIDGDSYPPRQIFGMYLQDLANDTIKLAKDNNIDIIIRTECEVFNVIRKEADKPLLVLDKGATVEADEIIFCIGHLPSDNYKELQKHTGYYHCPWPVEKISLNVPNDEHVVLIGTRLTAIDTVLGLIASGHTGKITMISRNGMLPAVIGPTSSYKRQHLTLETIKEMTNDDSIDLELNQLLDLFWKEIELAEGKQLTETDRKNILKPSITSTEWLEKEIKAANSGERKWQSVLASLYRFVPHLWKKLSDESKQIFLQDYYSIWMTYLAAFPLESARKILDLIKKGQLEVVGGFEGISYDADKMLFAVKQKSAAPLYVKYIINATGAGHDITNTNIPLLDNMLKSGLISPHYLGGINVVFKSLNIINSYGAIIPNMYVVGDMTWGVCMATADLGQIHNEASRAINYLWDTYLKPKIPTNSKLNPLNKHSSNSTENIFPQSSQQQITDFLRSLSSMLKENKMFSYGSLPGNTTNPLPNEINPNLVANTTTSYIPKANTMG